MFKQKISIIFPCILILCFFICTGCSSKRTLDLKKIANIKYNGFNGNGIVSITIDDDIYTDKEMLKKLFPDNGSKKAREKLTKLTETLEYSFSISENLSNGDEIKVNVDYDEELFDDKEINVENTEFTITVDGLPEATKIDPFDRLNITYTGSSPYVKAAIDSTKCESFVNQYISFNIEDKFLRNGDTFTVTADYDELFAEENGFIVTNDSKTYTVQNQPQYVISLDGLDLTNLQSEIDDKLTALTAANEGDSSFANISFWGSFKSIIDQKYLTSYFISLKPSFEDKFKQSKDLWSYYNYNQYIQIYEYTIDIGSNKKNIYIAIYANNIQKNEDGSISWDIELGSLSIENYESLVNNLVISEKEFYNISEIKEKD